MDGDNQLVSRLHLECLAGKDPELAVHVRIQWISGCLCQPICGQEGEIYRLQSHLVAAIQIVDLPR